MGQTLTNGIYLPDEGERNSYSGLEANWRALDALILTINGKAAPNVANTWTAAQTFNAGIAGDLTGNVTGNVTGDLTGTASKAIADEDGTSIKSGYVNVAGNQTVTGDKSFTGSNTFNNILPNTTNTYSLGSSTNQWSSVYAQTYYYNGTAWGLDKSNTWTNVNTFSMATAESIAVKHVTYKGAILFRTNGVSSFKNYNTFLKWDINGYDNSFGLYRSIGILGDTTAGATDEDIDTSFSLWKAHIRSKSLDFTNSVKATNDGTENSLKPITTSVTDLGTSTNKWKTLNGVNPGALSLPDISNAISIDTTGWDLTGNAFSPNWYMPTVDGWLCVIAFAGTMTDAWLDIWVDALWGQSASQSPSGELFCMIPVRANLNVRIRVKASSIYDARLFVASGNV
jgi:hypothetical protein